MQAIRGRDTRPELLVRKALHARGFRYRIAPATLAGKPDLWLPKYRAAVFVSGCFWHAHDCDRFRLPATRRDFWADKLSSNVRRDRKTLATLAKAGIRVLVIWECSLKGPGRLHQDLAVRLTETWLRSGSRFAAIDSEGLCCFSQPEYARMTGIITTV
ncbi:very short patch repair endonuclease [Veronia nyctiphanis]|uniref:Very short patch repair endonuclease n=2 Tax=Veronia nyctiphanis TaxID=1278244 RepID=A0A4Q0YQ09_9GAMM|nr:very short patch repair endonuclease [Veronia nyctiphanis]RXJ72084.1 very short patch repair endonuclease [Veronia nyctiphanis]